MANANHPKYASPVPGIETARFLAVFMLVTYHVVGSSPTGGLKIPADHPISLANAFLADIRMPLFACIAGFVYALKPVQAKDLGRFLSGKFRRLALPGAAAIAIFLIFCEVMGTRMAMGRDWPSAFFTSYAHFWFLQAILVIFVVYGSFDILTKGKWLIPSLIAAVVIYLMVIRFSVSFMSINRAFYLLPYFIFGILLCRNAGAIQKARPAFLACAVLAFVCATAMNVGVLVERGHFSASYRDVQSLLAGSSVAAICLFALPRVSWLQGFGPLSFTIYLYHIFGTSLARRGLQYMDIGDDQFLIHIPLGILAGFAVPYVIHRIASDYSIGQQLVLGQRLRLSRS